MSDKTIGKRFSHVHLVDGEPVKDSEKARFRLAKLTEKLFRSMQRTYSSSAPDFSLAAQEKIEGEIGVRFSTHGSRSWILYFEKISLLELLDSITIIAEVVHSDYRKEDWRGFFVQEAERIFREENLAYCVDELGGAHPLVDATFSASMASAIASMDNPRYAVSLECIDQIDGCLLQTPQDFIGAIRAVFGACENTFKLMYGVPRLDAKTAGERIGNDQQRLYADHRTLQSASSKTLEAFKQWVNAAHFYRHEQGVEEPNQPAQEVAILLVSQGLSFVRWLTALDQKSMRSDGERARM